MSLTFFFDKTVDIMRLEDTANTDNEAFGSTNVADVSCIIQPLDDSYGEDLEGSYGKDFLMFCSVIDIKQGDKVVQGATEYLVQSIESYDFVGQTHIEARIRLTK